ncbi:ceramide synthase 6 [Lepeophtheirus salmonis]|uniref:ceramide synthase 6 n=1 Tax=Lepeophtheirus salmonis TaxID=72036 RepID=UPI00077EF8E5|nr:ceramide synthase 6-like [Lepeophtheirus salmonis]
MNSFWNEGVWLPPNITWRNLEPTGEFTYNNFNDLYKPIPMALLVLVIRFWVERLVFRPLGLFLGLGSTKKNLPMLSNLELEDYYLKHKDKPLTFFKREALNLAVNLNMSERKIQRWFRMRRGADKSKLLDKFSETGWVCLYYTCVYIFGLSIMLKKSWIWDIRNCWYHYPHHLIDTDIWWYYMVELSFYWSLLFSQFYDVKRKDFWEMFIHHLTTIALMGFSWTCNLTRVGTLVLIIHDIADIFLGLAKLCKYAKYHVVCDILFVCFAIVWIVTRIGIYPCWILYSTTIEAPQILEMFPAYYIFNILLSVLLVLNVTWTYFILKIIHQSVFKKKFEKDSRSESSDSNESLSS